MKLVLESLLSGNYKKMKDIYWHLQMFLPGGRENERIDSRKMLEEAKPIIGTGEWDNLQCEYFKSSNNGGMCIGDIVLVREGGKPLAICEVISDCFQDQRLTDKYVNKNYRYVKTLEFYNDIKPFPQAQGTLQRLTTKDTDSWQFINNWYKQILNNMETTQIVDILRQKKQIIIQGAPGTGKTYITASVALSLIGIDYDANNHKDIMTKYQDMVDKKRVRFTTFHQSMDYEDFVEGLKPKVDQGNVTYEVKDGIFKSICEDATQEGNLDELEKAIESFKQKCKESVVKVNTTTGVPFSVVYRGGRTFRVRSDNSKTDEDRDFPANIDAIKEYYKDSNINPYNISYVRGILEYLKDEYKIAPYQKEVNAKDVNYVLIIDEINRGNISKIFGELITLLEADKRKDGSHPINAILPYSQEEFCIPSNLYIIGTMNTTDRSVGHIDYAVRRRFAFYTLEANKGAINSYYDNIQDEDNIRNLAIELFENIQDFISQHKSPEFDIEDLMTGHSYFMAATKKELLIKVTYEIIPLLREYEKDGIISLSEDQRKALGKEWREMFV